LDYYEGSAPPGGQQPTASLPAHGGQPQDGSHVHRRSIDGGGAQLSPCSLATSTPQTFPMASAPATKYRPRSRHPTRAGVHCSSTHIRQVGADAALKGVRPLVRSRYTIPSRLPGPGRLAVPARPMLPPTPCASTTRLPPASTTRCDGPPLDLSFHSIIDASWRTSCSQHIRASRRGGHGKARARSPSRKRPTHPAFSQRAPRPGTPDATTTPGRPGQQPSRGSFMAGGVIAAAQPARADHCGYPRATQAGGIGQTQLLGPAPEATLSSWRSRGPPLEVQTLSASSLAIALLRRAGRRPRRSG
jgi:hypothetical protein